MTEKPAEKPKERAEEAYALSPIPLELRKPWTYHAAAWAGVCFVLAAFMGGGTPLAYVPGPIALATILIGNIVLFTIFFLTSYIGAKHGVSTYLIAEQAVGKWGARAIVNWVLSGIPATCWFGVETWLAGAAIAALLGWDIGGPGRLMDPPSATFTMISGIVHAIPPVLGITSIAIVDYISIPAMAALTIYGAYLAVAAVGLGMFTQYVPPAYTPQVALINIMATINLVIGLIACGATIAPDTARWIRPKKKEVFLASLLGFFLVAVFMEIIGMFYGLASIKAGLSPDLAWNIVLVLVKLGVAASYLWPLLALAWILQFTTNMINAYAAGLAITASIGKSKYRPHITMAAAIFGSILAVLGIVWYWIDFLNALANWILPAAGVIIGEFYVIRKGVVEIKPPKKIEISGFIGWLIGGLVAFSLTAARLTYFVPSVIGFFLAMAIHVAWKYLTKK
jgi:cytosine permease